MDKVICKACQHWPRDNGAKGSWRMCRKWFRLMPEDGTCSEGVLDKPSQTACSAASSPKGRAK